MTQTIDSGYFDDAAIWDDGVPDSGTDWTINVGHTVTVQDTARNVGPGHVAGDLIVGDGVASRILVVNGQLTQNHGGTLRVLDGCALKLTDGNTYFCCGNVRLEGTGTIGPYAPEDVCTFAPMTVDYEVPGDPSTLHFHNPHNIQLPGSDVGFLYTQLASVPYIPADGAWYVYTFDNMPSLAAVASSDNVDMNTFSPGEIARDFAFAWNIAADALLPLVWPVLDGAVLADVEVTITRLSDVLWAWAITIPELTAEGARMAVYTAHGSPVASIFTYAMQIMRAEVRKPWATFDQVAGIDDLVANVAGIASGVVALQDDVTRILTKTDLIVLPLSLVSSVVADGSIVIVRKADHKFRDGRSWDFSDPGNWPSLTGATLTLTMRKIGVNSDPAALVLTGSVIAATSGPPATPQIARFEATHTDTASLVPSTIAGDYLFDVVAVLSNGDVFPIMTQGSATVVSNITGSVPAGSPKPLSLNAASQW